MNLFRVILADRWLDIDTGAITLGKPIPLLPPPALFAIQLNIESVCFPEAVGSALSDGSLSSCQTVAEESSVVDSVIGSCKINKHNTCWFVTIYCGSVLS